MEAITQAVFDIGVELAIGVLAVVAAFVLAKARTTLDAIQTRTGLEISEAARLRLEDAIQNAVQQAEDRIGAATPESVETYLHAFNPDDLRFFGLYGTRLRERVAAGIARYRGGS